MWLGVIFIIGFMSSKLLWTGKESIEPGAPIRADARYLEAQPLPTQLVKALASKERVYVSGRPHRVKSMGISENGQIIGKLEPVEPSNPN